MFQNEHENLNRDSTFLKMFRLKKSYEKKMLIVMGHSVSSSHNTTFKTSKLTSLLRPLTQVVYHL